MMEKLSGTEELHSGLTLPDEWEWDLAFLIRRKASSQLLLLES